jgi:hypothetical protein
LGICLPRQGVGQHFFAEHVADGDEQVFDLSEPGAPGGPSGP